MLLYENILTSSLFSNSDFSRSSIKGDLGRNSLKIITQSRKKGEISEICVTYLSYDLLLRHQMKSGEHTTMLHLRKNFVVRPTIVS